MIGWPSRFCSSSPSARTKMSLVPPALLAVMTRMGLLGQACALRGRGDGAGECGKRCEQQGERLHRVALVQLSLSKPPRVAPEDLFLVGGGNIQILDQLDRARLQRRERRRVAAVQHAVRPHPVQHHLHRRRIVTNRVEIHHLQIMARRVLDLHRRVGAEEERLVLQFVGVVHPADGFADAAAAVRGHDLQLRKILQHAAHDHPPERQAQVERPADARGEAIVPHPLLAEAEMRRMDHHRHVEVLHQLPERPRLVVVGIVPLVAGVDEDALEPELLMARSVSLMKAGPPQGRMVAKLYSMPL